MAYAANDRLDYLGVSYSRQVMTHNVTLETIKVLSCRIDDTESVKVSDAIVSLYHYTTAFDHKCPEKMNVTAQVTATVAISDVSSF